MQNYNEVSYDGIFFRQNCLEEDSCFFRSSTHRSRRDLIRIKLVRPFVLKNSADSLKTFFYLAFFLEEVVFFSHHLSDVLLLPQSMVEIETQRARPARAK